MYSTLLNTGSLQSYDQAYKRSTFSTFCSVFPSYCGNCSLINSSLYIMGFFFYFFLFYLASLHQGASRVFFFCCGDLYFFKKLSIDQYSAWVVFASSLWKKQNIPVFGLRLMNVLFKGEFVPYTDPHFHPHSLKCSYNQACFKRSVSSRNHTHLACNNILFIYIYI